VAVERDPAEAAGAAVRWLARRGELALISALGGAERTRVIVLLAAVLALSSADAATVGGRRCRFGARWESATRTSVCS
jgi:hypothetical protein